MDVHEKRNVSEPVSYQWKQGRIERKVVHGYIH